MRDEVFSDILNDAVTQNNRDEFVSDWTLSGVWCDDDTNPDERAALCGQIWDLAHLSIKEIRAATGLTQDAFGRRFMVPTRTVKNWENGTRHCPLSTRLMLARLCKIDANSAAALFLGG